MKALRKLSSMFGCAFVAFALFIGTLSANSACALYLYQPKVPNELKMK